MSFNIKSVLISDEVAPKCIEILESNGISVIKNTSLTKDELKAEIKKHDGLIVRSATKVTADVLEAGSRLKIVGRAGTGVDNIDCVAATAAGILVMNTPGGNTLSAAEHTCAMICAVTRNISQGTESLRAGRWDRKKFMGSELMGKTLAIIGLGRIGKEVATRMQAFGMTTIGYDPIIPGSVSAEYNCEWMELEKLWPLADYITVHVPLIPPTKNMINAEVMAKCKRGVKIINCARGGIVDESALLDGLKSGQVGGAGLDVFVQEPPSDLSLVKHANCVSTPHLGASTVEAQSRVAEDIALQFVELAAGRSLVGGINGQVLAQALSPSSGPWVTLAKTLGRLLVSACSDAGTAAHPVEVLVCGGGQCLQNAESYLCAAVQAGLLTARSGKDHNLISAPAAAKSAGLSLAFKCKDSGDCASKTCIKVSCGEVQLAGALGVGGASVLTEFHKSVLLQPLNINSAGSLVFLTCSDLAPVFSVAGVVEGYSALEGTRRALKLAAVVDISAMTALPGVADVIQLKL